MNYHQHLLIDASVNNPPRDEESAKAWLSELVKAVDMEVFGGPYAQYCDDPCNQGLSGFIWLTTSHASFHFWDGAEQPFVKFDLYSCKEYKVETVLELFKVFAPKTLKYTVINRTTGEHVIDESGTIEYD